MGRIIYVLLKQKKQTARPSRQQLSPPIERSARYISGAEVCSDARSPAGAPWSANVLQQVQENLCAQAMTCSHQGTLPSPHLPNGLGAIKPRIPRPHVPMPPHKWSRLVLAANTSGRLSCCPETARRAKAVLLSWHVSPDRDLGERGFPTSSDPLVCTPWSVSRAGLSRVLAWGQSSVMR